MFKKEIWAEEMAWWLTAIAAVVEALDL